MHLARLRGHACAGGRLRVWPRTKLNKKRTKPKGFAGKKGKPMKKTVKKTLAKKRGTPKKKLAKKKPTLKKAAVKTKALGKKTTGAKTPAALRTRVRRKSQSVDTEGLAELIEEGNAFEADAVTGVEHPGDTDEKEVHTHEVPQDDVPGEYLDKE